jgi:hypothetical protein
VDLVRRLFLFRVYLLVPVSLEESIRFPEDLLTHPLGALPRGEVPLLYVPAAVLTPVPVSPARLVPEIIVIVVAHVSFSSCFLIRTHDGEGLDSSFAL